MVPLSFTTWSPYWEYRGMSFEGLKMSPIWDYYIRVPVPAKVLLGFEWGYPKRIYAYGIVGSRW